jgi:hypothetical protein
LKSRPKFYTPKWLFASQPFCDHFIICISNKGFTSPPTATTSGFAGTPAVALSLTPCKKALSLAISGDCFAVQSFHRYFNVMIKYPKAHGA